MNFWFKALIMFAIFAALLSIMVSPSFAVDWYSWDNDGGTSNRADVAINWDLNALPANPPEPCAPIQVSFFPSYDWNQWVEVNYEFFSSPLGSGTYGMLVEDGMNFDIGQNWDNRYWLNAIVGGTCTKIDSSALVLEGNSLTYDSLTQTGGNIECCKFVVLEHYDAVATISGGNLYANQYAYIGWLRTDAGNYEGTGILNVTGDAVVEFGYAYLGYRYSSSSGSATGIINMSDDGLLKIMIHEIPDATNGDGGPDGTGSFYEPRLRCAYRLGDTGIINLHGGTIYMEQAWVADNNRSEGDGRDICMLQLEGDIYDWNDNSSFDTIQGNTDMDVREGVLIMGKGDGPSGDAVDHLVSSANAGKIAAYGYHSGTDSEYGTLVSIIVTYDNTAEETTLQASLVGDVDVDGDVDDYDLAVMMTNHGMTEDATWSMGDMDDDGDVDDDDVAKLCANWLKTRADITPNPVPEPSSLILFLSLAIAAFIIRRK